MSLTSLRSFMDGHPYAEILCLYKRAVVRRLVVIDSTVEIHAGDGEVVPVPLDTRLHYEPWVMDRGSILFYAVPQGWLKLCTEFDIVRYDDGSERQVEA